MSFIPSLSSLNGLPTSFTSTASQVGNLWLEVFVKQSQSVIKHSKEHCKNDRGMIVWISDFCRCMVFRREEVRHGGQPHVAVDTGSQPARSQWAGEEARSPRPELPTLTDEPSWRRIQGFDLTFNYSCWSTRWSSPPPFGLDLFLNFQTPWMMVTIYNFHAVNPGCFITYNARGHSIGRTTDAGDGWLSIVRVRVGSGEEEDFRDTRSEQLSVSQTFPLSVHIKIRASFTWTDTNLAKDADIALQVFQDQATLVGDFFSSWNFKKLFLTLQNRYHSYELAYFWVWALVMRVFWAFCGLHIVATYVAAQVSRRTLSKLISQLTAVKWSMQSVHVHGLELRRYFEPPRAANENVPVHMFDCPPI